MVIPADTSKDVLTRMYNADVGEDSFDYYNCIELLADWIEEVGWAYVPLQHAMEYALFVTSRRNRHLVDHVKAKLAAACVEPVFEVVRADGRQKWTGPIYPE